MPDQSVQSAIDEINSVANDFVALKDRIKDYTEASDKLQGVSSELHKSVEEMASIHDVFNTVLEKTEQMQAIFNENGSVIRNIIQLIPDVVRKEIEQIVEKMGETADGLFIQMGQIQSRLQENMESIDGSVESFPEAIQTQTDIAVKSIRESTEELSTEMSKGSKQLEENRKSVETVLEALPGILDAGSAKIVKGISGATASVILQLGQIQKQFDDNKQSINESVKSLPIEVRSKIDDSIGLINESAKELLLQMDFVNNRFVELKNALESLTASLPAVIKTEIENAFKEIDDKIHGLYIQVHQVQNDIESNKKNASLLVESIPGFIERIESTDILEGIKLLTEAVGSAQLLIETQRELTTDVDSFFKTVSNKHDDLSLELGNKIVSITDLVANLTFALDAIHNGTLKNAESISSLGLFVEGLLFKFLSDDSIELREVFDRIQNFMASFSGQSSEVLSLQSSIQQLLRVLQQNVDIFKTQMSSEHQSQDITLLSISKKTSTVEDIVRALSEGLQSLGSLAEKLSVDYQVQVAKISDIHDCIPQAVLNLDKSTSSLRELSTHTAQLSQDHNIQTTTLQNLSTQTSKVSEGVNTLSVDLNEFRSHTKSLIRAYQVQAATNAELAQEHQDQSVMLQDVAQKVDVICTEMPKALHSLAEHTTKEVNKVSQDVVALRKEISMLREMTEEICVHLVENAKKKGFFG